MSTFSLNEFYQRNRRVVIWAILFLLLWLLRDFFGLVFLTFVVAIVAAPFADFGTRRLRLPHWAALSLVYVLFLVVLASFVRFVVPSVASEVNRLIGNLPTTEERLIEVKNRLVDRYPSLRQPLNGYLRSALPDERLAVIDKQLGEEAKNFNLTPLQIEEAAIAITAPVGPFADYFNRQDQLYLSALMSTQFQRVRQYAPAVIKA
ncbi:MAG TPA: AI-2E family transporter, partial [Gammaproteobacteria bacterium]|nr:AI-2E family transporter [Gammaproteobacteria bacterium]